MREQELGKILIYQNEKGDTKIDVYFENGDIWLSQKNLARLYQTSPQNITMHIKNIYSDGELMEESTCKEFLQVQNEGGRQIERHVKHYNFQMILERIRDIRASEKRFYEKVAYSGWELLAGLGHCLL